MRGELLVSSRYFVPDVYETCPNISISYFEGVSLEVYQLVWMVEYFGVVSMFFHNLKHTCAN